MYERWQDVHVVPRAAMHDLAAACPSASSRSTAFGATGYVQQHSCAAVLPCTPCSCLAALQVVAPYDPEWESGYRMWQEEWHEGREKELPQQFVDKRTKGDEGAQVRWQSVVVLPHNKAGA